MLQSVLSPFAPAQPERWTSYRTLEGFTVAECVVEQLEAEGIDAVFGIPGGYVSPFLGVLRGHPRMRFVIACHEGGAAFMADGYARAGGRLGVCLVTAGPGATNALTGIASAHLDGVPVLAISGQVPTDRFGLAAMQESTVEGGVDTVALLHHATAYSTSIVDAGSFPRLFRRALSVAHGVPRGAVHLSFPANVARQRLERVSLPVAPDRRPPAPACDPADAEAAFRLLSVAQRPLLYVGSGARDALETMGDGFRELAERWGIPVVTSMRGKGLFPETHELSLGVLGMAGSHRADRYVEDGVDVLMVLGSRLGEWASQNFSPRIRAAHAVIQVDVNPASIGQFLPPQLPIVADVRAVLAAMLECARDAGEPDAARVAERLETVRVLREEVPPWAEPAKLEDEGTPLKPQRLMAELDASLHGGVDLYVDMGNCTGWATHCLRVSPPTRVFYPSGLSSMGWSCGAVIGGKLARPERAAVALVGDGAFLMNGTEVNTAARYGVGAVYVVLNDDSLGMVNHGEHAQNGGAYPLDDPFYGLGGPDLAKFAESLGAAA
ncbi:MAG TPA: thiamine pyrophosphate-binding protein, partial [Longimicrobiaceae bacterium]